MELQLLADLLLSEIGQIMSSPLNRRATWQPEPVDAADLLDDELGYVSRLVGGDAALRVQSEQGDLEPRLPSQLVLGARLGDGREVSDVELEPCPLPLPLDAVDLV